MMSLRTLSAAALLLFAGLAAAAQAAPASPGAGAAEAEPPVRISANEAEYAHRRNLAVFTGKVVVVQGDTTLAADRVEVRFRPEGDSAAAGRGERIESMLATGNVSFRQVEAEGGRERYATGERGEYDAGTRVLTLTGGPRLWEGQNVVTGERIEYDTGARVFKVRGKAILTIYPDEGRPGQGPR